MNHLPMIYEMPKIKQRINDTELSKNNIYSCPQTMFKFHPDFDHVLAEILEKDKKGVLYLIKDNNKIYFNKLIERFKKIKYFDLDRVIFLDPLSRDNYINHLGTSSVLLDPLYFGAGNSFHESMVYGTPTVTMPTKFIKSRIVSAAYMQMEIEKPPIVKNKNEYVELAIDIANNDNLLGIKNTIKRKLMKNYSILRKQVRNLIKYFSIYTNDLLKHSIVFFNKQAIVSGPTPPGTGVIAFANFETSSKSTSPTIPSSV